MWLFGKITERADDIHKASVRVMNATIVVGLLNILYDIIVISAFEEDPTPGSIDIARIIVGILNSIIFSIAMVVASLYGSKTLGSHAPDEEMSILRDLKHRYVNSDLKLEAVRVLREIQQLNVLETSPLYHVFFRFRKSVLDNLLYRTNLSILMNMLLSFAAFYNYIILLIYYSRRDVVKGIQAQALYLTLNVVNPLVSLVFSYILVLCDNVNSIIVYIERARLLKDLPADQSEVVIMQMEEYCGRIERPFVHELNQVP